MFIVILLKQKKYYENGRIVGIKMKQNKINTYEYKDHQIGNVNTCSVLKNKCTTKVDKNVC